MRTHCGALVSGWWSLDCWAVGTGRRRRSVNRTTRTSIHVQRVAQLQPSTDPYTEVGFGQPMGRFHFLWDEDPQIRWCPQYLHLHCTRVLIQVSSLPLSPGMYMSRCCQYMQAPSGEEVPVVYYVVAPRSRSPAPETGEEPPGQLHSVGLQKFLIFIPVRGILPRLGVHYTGTYTGYTVVVVVHSTYKADSYKAHYCVMMRRGLDLDLGTRQRHLD